ncbi:MAG: hypothetical protein FLDDKLPJ_01603 [Phycisphaerae bacterium]|nr:hypothetical protein [Phycisphaerae bacterium]
MDAFENLVATLVHADGYWVRTSFAVELTKDEKRAVDNPTMPRPEIDVLAYKPALNEVLVIECKSYLDSTGVTHRNFTETSKHRYKLFHNPVLWRVVGRAIIRQLEKSGAILSGARATLCLATGRIRNNSDRELLHAVFSKRGWRLFDDRWISERTQGMAKSAYVNDAAIIALKMADRFRGAS